MRYIGIFLLVLISQFGFAQSLKEFYDQSSYFTGPGFSNNSNVSPSDLQGAEQNILLSFLVMYRATKEIKYLDKFIEDSKKVMNQRDDRWSVNNSNFTSRQNYCGDINPTWVTILGTLPKWGSILGSGRITYPFADYAVIVKIDDPTIYSLALPGGLAFTDNFAPFDVITTYGEYAEWLQNRIEETLDYHHNSTFTQQWSNSQGYMGPDWYDWRACADILIGGQLAINMQAVMGKTLALMYILSVQDGAPNQDYKNKVTHIASSNLMNPASTGISLVGNHYEWYHDRDFTWPEDLLHGAWAAEFANICYQRGLTNNAGNALITLTDMNRFAQTFSESMYKEPLHTYNGVDGTDTECWPCSGTPNAYWANVGDWLFLSEFDQDIYHMVSDQYAEYKTFSPLHPQIYLGLASLIYYRNLFEPILVDRTPGNGSNWVGVSSGDLDGDGKDEIVAVRNGNVPSTTPGGLFVIEYTNTNQFYTQSFVPTAYGSQWADITAGDFDGDGIDEVMAVRNAVTPGFFMSELVGGVLTGLTQYTAANASSQWAGIAAGDFDGDGIDEIVAVRNLDGNFFMMDVIGGVITPKVQTTGINAWSAWVDVTAGDFDGDGLDEFVGVRNLDGNLYMYELSSSGVITFVKKTTGGSSTSQWTDLTAGDFDGDGVDEIIARRSYDGDMFLYELDGNLANKGEELFKADWNIGALGSGNFRAGEIKDDLIVFRNFDGDQFVFDTKVYNNTVTCTNLSLQYTTINTQNIATNTVKEYFAKNTITAGPAYVINVGADVSMRAGTKITLKPGFHAVGGCKYHAFIDPSIDCTQITGKWAQNTNEQNNSVTPSLINLDNGFLEGVSDETVNADQLANEVAFQADVYPNPNTGTFTLSIQSEMDAEVYIVDIMGELIYQSYFSGSGKQQIDLSKHSRGIYYMKIVSGEDIVVKKIIRH